jgi:hypothetical protein
MSFEEARREAERLRDPRRGARPAIVQRTETPSEWPGLALRVFCWTGCGGELPAVVFSGSAGSDRALLDVDSWHQEPDGIWTSGREHRQRRSRRGRGGPYADPDAHVVRPMIPIDPDDAALGLHWVNLPAYLRCPRDKCARINVLSPEALNMVGLSPT